MSGDGSTFAGDTSLYQVVKCQAAAAEPQGELSRLREWAEELPETSSSVGKCKVPHLAKNKPGYS